MTVTEIAKLANVSIATVDRVLHNRGRVSAETKDKIEKIVKDSGYQADPLARHLKKRSQYHIGVLIPKPKTAFGYWEKLFNGIKETAEQEFAAFSFTINLFSFIRDDEKSLLEAINKMKSSECEAYIIAPIMPNQIKTFLLDSEISKPYCFVDSTLPGCNPVSVIAQNPYQAGLVAARLTQLFTPKSGTFAVVKPYTGAFNLDERAKGFCDWFTENRTDCKAVIIETKISEESVEEKIKGILSKYSDLIGICSVSVETFLISKALKKINPKEKIVVTGFDLVDDNREELKNKNIDALIDQKPYEQGVLALRQLFKKLIYEENCEQEINIPIEIFLKENLI